MRTFISDGIIIKRRNTGETDRMLVVFTKEMGKFTVKASGIRKFASRRSAHVELLNYSTLSLYKGPGLPILQDAQVKNSFSNIKESLDKIVCSYHLCELIDGLIPENQVESEVFDMFMRTFERINSAVSVEEAEKIVYEFELGFLKALGYIKDTTKLDKLNLINIIENTMERKLRTRKIFLPAYIQEYN